MILKVTFDTNVFNKLINLEENEDKTYYETILKNLKKGDIKGYFSDTFITLEGVRRIDRENIFGSRKVLTKTSNKSKNEITISFGTSMLSPQLNEIHLHKIQLLTNLGIKGLRGQMYLGDNFIVPPTLDIYESTDIDLLIAYRAKMAVVECAIAEKCSSTGVHIGKNCARELGLSRLKRANRDGEIWYQGLGLSQNNSESKETQSAIAEWADGDSIIRHIGYGNDYFCTLDNGKSAKAASIFDAEHKKWLNDKFGVKFIIPSDLANLLS